MPLVLDLVRHGQAEPPGPGGDRSRRLSEQGQRAIRRLAERIGRPPARVFASPLERARQTASLLVHGLGLAIPVEELEELTPDHDPGALFEALAQLGADSGHVALVGHQPQMGRVVEYLTGRRGDFAPGQMVRVACPQGPGRRSGTIELELRPESGRS